MAPEAEGSSPYSQEPATGPYLANWIQSVHFQGPCTYFATNMFYGGEVVSLPPNPQAGGPPPVGCPRLLIQYIRSYPPYLEAISSIRDSRTRHAIVTRDPLNITNVYTSLKVLIFHVRLLCWHYTFNFQFLCTEHQIIWTYIAKCHLHINH
jgi:hypothetical protein